MPAWPRSHAPLPLSLLSRAEPEAVDLLLEVERISLLEGHADDKNYARTCLYLLGALRAPRLLLRPTGGAATAAGKPGTADVPRQTCRGREPC